MMTPTLTVMEMAMMMSSFSFLVFDAKGEVNLALGDPPSIFIIFILVWTCKNYVMVLCVVCAT